MTNKESIIKGLESLHERLLDAAKQNVIATLDAYMVADALALLKEQPEIVRCGNCIYHRYDNDGIPYCKLIDYGYGWKDEEFCNRGKGGDA